MKLKLIFVFRALLTSFCLFFLFFLFPQKTFAVTVSLSNIPNTITSEPFTLTASVSGATAGTNYLRIDLFKDGSINYFGETFNGSDYYSGSTYSQYLPITIQSGTTWTGSIQGRIGSPSSTDYDGNGTYKARLRRYTSGGGYSSTEANNSAVLISINLPTPTPTLTPTATPTPTPSATNSNTPTPTVQSTIRATTTPIATKVGLNLTNNIATKSDVLGTNSVFATPKIVNKEVETLADSENNFSKISLLLGAIILLSGVGFYFKKRWIKQ